MTRLGVRNLSKRFGALRAVVDATFAVGEGEIVGLLGPNGAGKSTLFECIAGLLPVDGGEVLIDDATVPADARRASLLFLPDGIAPWSDQSSRWILDFGSRAFGASGDWRTELSPSLK